MKYLILIAMVLSGCATWSPEAQLNQCLRSGADQQYCYATYNANVQRQISAQQMMQTSYQPQPVQPRRRTCINTAPGIVQCFDR